MNRQQLLDVTIQAQILELLAELQKTEGMALLFITHDLGVVHKISDRVNVMQGGHIVEAGPTKDIFDNPQNDYTKMLLSAEPTGARADPCRERCPRYRQRRKPAGLVPDQTRIDA
jgi:microcin C transport system ATP-binding protein